MGSSVIFLVIIGLWAVFLVPHLVRHRADLGSSRARDRFSTAMRVLGRRATAPRTRGSGGRGYLHRPRLPQQRADTAAPRRARASGAKRGSRWPLAGFAVLALLVSAVLAVPAAVAAALLGVVPHWVAPLPAGALVALLTVLRARALRRRAVRGRRSYAAAGATGRPTADPVAVPSPVETAPEPAEVAPVDAPVPVTETADDGTWTPVPVPPPTYTLKPAASRRFAPPDPAAAPPPAAWDLDEVLERRRAAAG